jgi:hypothetical protein
MIPLPGSIAVGPIVVGLPRVVWLLAAGSVAVTLPICARQATDGSNITVALVTFGPGEIYWERFGHNGIWIRDPELGFDSIFDYGRFNFAEPGFIWNFVKGRMEYSIGSASARRYIEYYQSVNRTIWVQELNLTLTQKIALRDFLVWNNRPENQRYRYHYFYDNCSTRVRDALDAVIAGGLHPQLDTLDVGVTFRSHSLRLSSYNLALYTGLLIGLGSPTDRELTASAESFIPMRLMEHLRTVTNVMDDGVVVPLVASEQIVFESTRDVPPERPPRFYVVYLLGGILLAGIMGALSVLAARGPHMRWPFTTFAVLWSLLLGVSGSLLVFLWAFTDHNTSYWNENLFFLSPLALPVAVALPFALRGKIAATRWAVYSAGVIALLSVLGCALQVLPGFDQANGQVVALFLPPNVVLLIGIIAVLGHPGRRQSLTSTA